MDVPIFIDGVLDLPHVVLTANLADVATTEVPQTEPMPQRGGGR